MAKHKKRAKIDHGVSYGSRQKFLEDLGFPTYADYLKSDLWRDVRKKVYAQCGDYCFLCGEPATELHHNRYHKNDLTGKKTQYIKPICHKCHQEIEFEFGKKVSCQKACRKFWKKRKQFLEHAGERLVAKEAKTPSIQPTSEPYPFGKKRSRWRERQKARRRKAQDQKRALKTLAAQQRQEVDAKHDAAAAVAAIELKKYRQNRYKDPLRSIVASVSVGNRLFY